MAADPLVVDASVAVKAALGGGLGDLAGYRVAAPTLLWSEAAAALRQLAWRAEITTAEANAALWRLLDAEIEAHASRSLVGRALAIAEELGWAKSYDAEYVALAELLDAPLMTIDARLAASAARFVTIQAPGAG